MLGTLERKDLRALGVAFRFVATITGSTTLYINIASMKNIQKISFALQVQYWREGHPTRLIMSSKHFTRYIEV